MPLYLSTFGSISIAPVFGAATNHAYVGLSLAPPLGIMMAAVGRPPPQKPKRPQLHSNPHHLDLKQSRGRATDRVLPCLRASLCLDRSESILENLLPGHGAAERCRVSKPLTATGGRSLWAACCLLLVAEPAGLNEQQQSTCVRASVRLLACDTHVRAGTAKVTVLGRAGAPFEAIDIGRRLRRIYSGLRSARSSWDRHMWLPNTCVFG